MQGKPQRAFSFFYFGAMSLKAICSGTKSHLSNIFSISLKSQVTVCICTYGIFLQHLHG